MSSSTSTTTSCTTTTTAGRSANTDFFQELLDVSAKKKELFQRTTSHAEELEQWHSVGLGVEFTAVLNRSSVEPGPFKLMVAAATRETRTRMAKLQTYVTPTPGFWPVPREDVYISPVIIAGYVRLLTRYDGEHVRGSRSVMWCWRLLWEACLRIIETRGHPFPVEMYPLTGSNPTNAVVKMILKVDVRAVEFKDMLISECRQVVDTFIYAPGTKPKPKKLSSSSDTTPTTTPMKTPTPSQSPVVFAANSPSQPPIVLGGKRTRESPGTPLANVMGLTGIHRDQVAEFYELIKNRYDTLTPEELELFKDRDDVSCKDPLGPPTLQSVGTCIILIGSALTWESLAEVSDKFGGVEVCKKTCKRWWDALMLIIKLRPIMDPAERFRHTSERFPGVTCMVDGTVVPVRARGTIPLVDPKTGKITHIDNNHSGKHGMICCKLEIWTTLDGVPINVRGGVPGSWHDKVREERQARSVAKQQYSEALTAAQAEVTPVVFRDERMPTAEVEDMMGDAQVFEDLAHMNETLDAEEEEVTTDEEDEVRTYIKPARKAGRDTSLGEMFPHFQWEGFLADLGYQEASASHMSTPHKKDPRSN